MILSHFTKSAFNFNPNKVYDKEIGGRMKPTGLWLSNEAGDLTWRDFCVGERFNLDSLSFENLFLCDTKDWIVLSAYNDFEIFYREYALHDALISPFMRVIDWERVKEDFKGILISPFNYKAHYDFTWYYGWDCDSACAWDLTSISPYRG